MKQILIACLLCGRRGFTVRGLRAHWCPAKPATNGHMRHSAPLTKAEWKAAVTAADKSQARARA